LAYKIGDMHLPSDSYEPNLKRGKRRFKLQSVVTDNGTQARNREHLRQPIRSVRCKYAASLHLPH
jgi:hypothetical protein